MAPVRGDTGRLRRREAGGSVASVQASGRVRALRAVQGFATGVSVGATGLIVASVWTLSGGAIVDAPTLGIALAAGLLVGSSRVSSPLVIGGALALGLAAAAIGVW